MKELKFYYTMDCPFCIKVIKFMEENNITNLIPVDVNESEEYREELVSVGGKNQVPMLSIDGEAMYESDDIIKWLNDNLL